jgi:L-histidine N-alpha-methyltransferase
VINSRLGADFEPEHFEHVARWNGEESWIEMRLRSDRRQMVGIAELGLEVQFEDGEELLTEISAKFTPAGIAAELEAAGFVVDATWGDGPDEGEFLLTLAHPYC